MDTRKLSSRKVQVCSLQEPVNQYLKHYYARGFLCLSIALLWLFLGVYIQIWNSKNSGTIKDMIVKTSIAYKYSEGREREGGTCRSIPD